MVRTRVGYAGGKTENPTYHHLDGHSETVQLDFDPARISYEELLNIFWESHNPSNHAWSRQYMSIIFYHDEAQMRLATETKEREAARSKRKIYTEIVPFTRFYPAEDYHQKYWLQGAPEFMKEFRLFYPDFSQIVASTAAARVNGYLGGNGACATLQEELSSYGLSLSANRELLGLVCPSRASLELSGRPV